MMASPERVMNMRGGRWRTSFLGPRDAAGAPAIAAPFMSSNHVVDPVTELVRKKYRRIPSTRWCRICVAA